MITNRIFVGETILIKMVNVYVLRGVRTPIQVSCDISSGVAQRVVSARSGPRLKGMSVLDIEKDALLSETARFEFKPILDNEV